MSERTLTYSVRPERKEEKKRGKKEEDASERGVQIATPKKKQPTSLPQQLWQNRCPNTSVRALTYSVTPLKQSNGLWGNDQTVTPEKQQQQNCSNSYTKKDVQTPQLLNQPLKPEEEKN